MTLERMDAGGCGAAAMACVGWGGGVPSSDAFGLLAAVQLQGNDETCALVRILSALLCTTALLQDLLY